MKRWKFSPGQCAYALHRTDTGTPVGDACKEMYAHFRGSGRDASQVFVP